MQEHTENRIVREFDNLQLMKATFLTHEFPKHFHDTYVVQLVLNGEDNFHCDGKTYRANEGQIVVINPFEIHTGSPAKNIPLEYISFYPTIDLFKRYLAKMHLNEELLPLVSNRVFTDYKCAALIKKFHFNLSQNYDFMAAEEIFTSLVFLLTAKNNPSLNRNEKHSSIEPRLNIVREYIIENSTKNVSLSELADISGLSIYYMLRRFKKQFGITPHAYLTNVRLEKAKHDLIQGKPILASAVSNGFYDQSHFNRHFKKQFSITPAQFGN